MTYIIYHKEDLRHMNKLKHKVKSQAFARELGAHFYQAGTRQDASYRANGATAFVDCC